MCKGYIEKTKCTTCHSKEQWDIFHKPCDRRCGQMLEIDERKNKTMTTDYCDSRECKRTVDYMVNKILERWEEEKEKLRQWRRDVKEKKRRESKERERERKHERDHGHRRRHSR